MLSTLTFFDIFLYAFISRMIRNTQVALRLGLTFGLKSGLALGCFRLRLSGHTPVAIMIVVGVCHSLTLGSW